MSARFQLESRSQVDIYLTGMLSGEQYRNPDAIKTRALGIADPDLREYFISEGLKRLSK